MTLKLAALNGEMQLQAEQVLLEAIKKKKKQNGETSMEPSDGTLLLALPDSF